MHNKTFAFLTNPPIWFGLLPLWVCATSAIFLNDATMNPQSYASKTFIILSMAAFLYFIYSLSSFSARRKRAREMTTDEVMSKDLVDCSPPNGRGGGQRRYGVFACRPSGHQFAMATLLAWDLGEWNWLNVSPAQIGASRSGFVDVFDMADFYLENTAGTAFRSSVGKSIKAGKKGNLRDSELDFFGRVDYLV